mgnify:CR=1 FL=1
MTDGEEPLPPDFLHRLPQIYAPADAHAVRAAFQGERATCFRINPLRVDASARVMAELTAAGLTPQPITGLPEAYWVPTEQRRTLIDSTPAQSGQLYVQNAASMLPALLLAPRSEDWVLDLAAAPGSKTLQLAGMMANRGRISAVEVVRGRFFKLRANLARHGATNVQFYHKDGIRVGRLVPERFDRVLLDAPCSAEGQFQTAQPASFAYWSPQKIRDMQRKQRQLLVSALQCAKPGGLVLYATCTLAPEENEVVIDRLLQRYPQAVDVEAIAPPVGQCRPGLTAWAGHNLDPRLSLARRILPDFLMEGFFLCRLRKLMSVGKAG